MHATVIACTTDMPRADWLELRRNGIGSSDAAAITGHGKWSSPIGLYLDKTGALPLEEDEADHLLIGRMLEPGVGQIFQHKHPELIVRPHPYLLAHPEHGWMLADLDFLAYESPDAEPVAVVETKLAAYSKDQWGDDAQNAEDGIPQQYWIQVQHQLAVTGLSHAWVVVLHNIYEYAEKLIVADPAVMAGLIVNEERFWQRVIDRRPPPADGTDATNKALKDAYRNNTSGEAVVLPDEALTYRTLYEDAAGVEKQGKAGKQLAANELMALLGEHEVGLGPDGFTPIVTWKRTCPPSFDEEAFAVEHPDLYAAFKRPSPRRTIRFPKIKERTR